MKVSIEVQNRAEAQAIRTALDDPETRALVVVTGTLLQLPSDRARKRVLEFTADTFAEQQESHE